MSMVLQCIFCRESVVQRCSLRRVFLSRSEACIFNKKEALAQVFSCEFCKTSKNISASLMWCWKIQMAVIEYSAINLYVTFEKIGSDSSISLRKSDFRIKKCYQNWSIFIKALQLWISLECNRPFWYGW